MNFFTVIAVAFVAFVSKWIIALPSEKSNHMETEGGQVYVSVYAGENCTTTPLSESGIMTTDECTRVSIDGVHFYYRLTCDSSSASSSWKGTVYLDKMCDIKLSSLSGDDACTCVSASVREKSGSVRVNCGASVPATCP